MRGRRTASLHQEFRSSVVTTTPRSECPSRCNFLRARCSISARCLTKIAMSCAWPAAFLLTRSLFRRAVSVTRYLFEFAAVLHNEMDVIAASNNHENGPQTGMSLTYGGLSDPLQARAA